MLARLLPHPLISLTVALSWVLMVNTLTPNAILFGAVMGLIVPHLTRPFWPNPPRLRRPAKIVEYVLVVLWDIVVANVQVAMIVVFRRNASLRPAFICIPLDLRTPEAIAVLAGTITMTPGTVSADLSACGRSLLVHALDAPDPDAVRDGIKRRYEARLKEIFE